ncbi:MAG: hypothetical protein R3B82_29235 [Sandaracinaceae bacterium]
MTAGEMLTRMIDEVPAFCAIAATAKGRATSATPRSCGSRRATAKTSAEVLEAFGSTTPS